MWKMQQAMEDDVIRTARIQTTFIPVTGLKCSNPLALYKYLGHSFFKQTKRMKTDKSIVQVALNSNVSRGNVLLNLQLSTQLNKPLFLY